MLFFLQNYDAIYFSHFNSVSMTIAVVAVSRLVYMLDVT